MPIIHPNSAYPHISSLRNHWIHALSGRINLNTNPIKEKSYRVEDYVLIVGKHLIPVLGHIRLQKLAIQQEAMEKMDGLLGQRDRVAE